MSRITIATGKKTYEIADENGNVRGTISFNPKDMGFFLRVSEMKDKILKWLDELEALDITGEESEVVAKLNSYDTLIKNEINRVFDDENTSYVVFGNQCTYSTVNGVPMIETFLEVFMPIIQEEFNKEQEASKNRIENYTKQVK